MCSRIVRGEIQAMLCDTVRRKIEITNKERRCGLIWNNNMKRTKVGESIKKLKVEECKNSVRRADTRNQ
jgi:hypothetical protein